MSFRTRLSVALALCLLPAVAMAINSTVAIQRILEAEAHETRYVDLADETSKATLLALQCRRYEKDMMLNCGTPNVQAEYEGKWTVAANALHDKIGEVCRAAEETAGADDRAALRALAGDMEKYMTAVRGVIAEGRASGQSDPAALNRAMTPYKDVIRGVTTGAEVLAGKFRTIGETSQRSVQEAMEAAALQLPLGAMFTIGLGVIAVIVVPGLVTRRVSRLSAFADRVQNGELTARCPMQGRDEIGRLCESINAMLDEVAMAVERERAAASAEAEARQEGEAKMRFMANMSHEIRTPMTAILGFTDLLLEPALTAQTRINYIETIRRNGNHLLGVINDILDLSKIQSGKLALQIGGASVCRLVAEVAAMMRVRAAEKHLELMVTYEFPMPEEIQTDALRLRQVLLNLVGNAVKFTDKGEVRLVARADGLGAAHPYVTFQVIDTGVGISAEHITQLFKPFSQVDDSATRRFGGTGLGLCISKELAERLGGSLAVESEVGRGTTFTFRLPVGDISKVRLVHNAEEALAEPSTPPTELQNLRLSGRILLAEDGPDNQRLISLVLTKAGATVDIAGDGKQALEQALAARTAGRPYDLILMDMQMPVLDGYSATCELREQGYTGTIVALTAHALPADKQRRLLAGCDDYASKPIDRMTFIPLIHRLLSTVGDKAAAEARREARQRIAG